MDFDQLKIIWNIRCAFSSVAQLSPSLFLKLALINSPGTRINPGGCDQMMANIFMFKKKYYF